MCPQSDVQQAVIEQQSMFIYIYVCECICALTGQKYVFSVMCWATRGSEADRDMMSSRASLAC